MNKGKQPLAAALFGFDQRSYKTMTMFLQGPCKGAAVVVEPDNAEIDIIDADNPIAASILEERRAMSSERVIILMSLEEIRLPNTVFVKKPVNKEVMLEALAQVRQVDHKVIAAGYTESTVSDENIRTEQPDSEQEKPSEQGCGHKKEVDLQEQQKTGKHQSAQQYSEKRFASYLGTVAGIDYSDPQQALKASYNPRQYFQGFVKSAYLIARSKGRIVQLNAGWKPLMIFPRSQEVWLSTDDKQLRAFAGLPINNDSGNKISLTPVDGDRSKSGQDLEKFQRMEAFLWKLAIWTSKGRYPDNLDIKRPVYLKRWPNMTRLMVTPHALRIAALLIQGSRTLPEIARDLKINLQYVYVFVSACQAVDLLGQCNRNADTLLQPEPVSAKSKSGGLFRKILNKLRATKSE